MCIECHRFFLEQDLIGNCIAFFSAISSFLTALIAGFALVVSIVEYRNHIKREKAKTLSNFNERYVNDKSIERVTKLLTKYLDDGENNEEKDDIKKQFSQLELYDIEMFIRFFEEVEYAIEAGALDEKEIRYMFAYYALAAAETKPVKKEITTDDWYVFKHFVSRMNRIKPLDDETISNLNNL